MKYFKSLLVLLFLSESSLANVCSFGTKIFYGNGMLNSYVEALQSMNALEKLEFAKSNSLFSYDLAFNRNDSELLNFVTVVAQKLENDYTTAWKYIFGLQDLPNFDLINNSALFSESIALNQKRMLEQYRSALKEGNKVIIVSHSQGNFFAEEALNTISSFDHPWEIGLGNVRVASPTFSDYGFPLTTFSDDRIINGVRKFLGAPKPTLPAIGSGPAPIRDPLGHNFIKAYLNTPESGEKIQSDILKVISGTHYPRPGTAFKIQVNAPEEDGLVFEIKSESKKRDFVSMAIDEANDNLQRGSLECRDIGEEIYSLSLVTTFIQTDRCPCPFKVTLSFSGFEKSYEAAFSMKEGENEKRFAVIDGLLPVIKIKKRDKDYEISVEEIQYPVTRVE